MEKEKADFEKVYLAPQLRVFLCRTIKEDTDISEEFEIASEDGTKRKKVSQTIKGQTFITNIVFEQEMEEGNMREESKITYVLPLGTRLVWEEGEGYIVTKNNFQTLEEIEETLKLLK